MVCFWASEKAYAPGAVAPDDDASTRWARGKGSVAVLKFFFEVRVCYNGGHSWEEEPMGHYCRICGRERANEKFSGKGHKIHVCKDCMRLPQEERQAVEEEQEIWGYLGQEPIPPQNARDVAQRGDCRHGPIGVGDRPRASAEETPAPLPGAWTEGSV